MLDEGVRQKAERYLARARRALRTGHMVLEDGDYITAVNRAYMGNLSLSTCSVPRRAEIPHPILTLTC